ncbi:MAG: PH domain-containing protein [Clostridium sp.]|nr:PH domain-containing protein [Clostridium sp.]
MKKNRNSKLSIVLKILSSIKELVCMCISLLIITELKMKTIIVIGILLYLPSIIVSILRWFANTFYLDDNMFCYKTGVFIRKENKIPLDSILAIDLEENLKYRIFGLKKVKIDVGATDNIKDIEISLRHKPAVQLRNELLGKNIETTDNEEDIIYILDLKSLFLFAATRNKLADLIVISIGLIVFTYQFNINSLLTNLGSPLVIFLVVISSFLVIKIITVLITMNKYYNYKIKMQDNLLEITCGFVERKVYSLDVEKVFAVKTTQNILQRVNNKATISVSALGYQDNDSEEAVVFPYIDNNELYDILKTIFPKFIYKNKLYDINKKYKLRYKKYLFGYSDEVLYLCGGILNKRTNTILIDSVDEVCYKQGCLQRKYNTYNLTLGYRGKKLGDLARIKGVDKEHIENISEKVLVNE